MIKNITPHIRKYTTSIIFFAILLIIILSFRFGHQQQLITLPKEVLAVIRLLLIVVGTYFIASIIVRFTANRVTKTFADAEPEQRLLVMKLYTYIVYIIATTFIFWELGMTLQNITLFLGLIATGLAFAVRDVIISYLAWFILLTKRPFRIGDYIRIGDEEGKVQHIGTFFVLIDNSPERKDDFIRIPNRVFLEKPVYNYGKGLIAYAVKMKASSALAKKLPALKKEIARIIPSEVYLLTEKGEAYVTVNFTTTQAKRKKTEDAILHVLLKV